MTPDQRAQLVAADRRLLAQAFEFYTELSRITDLSVERQRRQPPPEHWWWYLDVLAQLPAPPQLARELSPV